MQHSTSVKTLPLKRLHHLFGAIRKHVLANKNAISVKSHFPLKHILKIIFDIMRDPHTVIKLQKNEEQIISNIVYLQGTIHLLP